MRNHPELKDAQIRGGLHVLGAHPVDGSTLVVSLSGVSRLGPNTGRFIDTRFFETPLSRVVAKKAECFGLSTK